MKKKIKLQFDRHLPYGSKEHFFHFMWGYLLPSISLIVEKKNKEEDNEILYCFDTCGPVMDKVIIEAVGLLSINGEIISRAEFELLTENMLVPRWDIYLLRDYILKKEIKEITHINKFQTCSDLKYFLSTPDFTRNFKAKILKVRSIFIECIAAHKDFNNYSFDTTNTILLIKRSEIHPFYSKEGSAEIKGYGNSRRGLVDIDEYVNKYGAENVNVRAYEPGAHSLFHQIITFLNVSWIIGIKGAEFANLIWLKEYSKVTWIRPEQMKTPNIQQKLSETLNLNYTEIISDTGNYPSILHLDPIKYFQ